MAMHSNINVLMADTGGGGTTTLKFEDEYINGMATMLRTRASDLQAKINTYILYMEGIRKNAILEGDTAEALDTFISYAQGLKEIVATSGDDAGKMLSNFLIEVDAKDDYLYEES